MTGQYSNYTRQGKSNYGCKCLILGECFKGTNQVFYRLLQHIKNGKQHVIENPDKILQPYIELVNPGRMINSFMNAQDAIVMFE